MNSEFKKIRELTQDIKLVMLTTLSEDGALHSRPMMTQEMDEEGNLWFFTSDKTGKVDELNQNHQLNLAYAQPDDGAFVSIAGTGEIVKDRAKIKELWNPGLKAWFPEGLEQPDLALLKVTIDSAEYWDAPQGKMIKLVKIAKAAITGQPFKSTEAEHGKTTINRH